VLIDREVVRSEAARQGLGASGDAEQALRAIGQVMLVGTHGARHARRCGPVIRRAAGGGLWGSMSPSHRREPRSRECGGEGPRRRPGPQNLD